MKFLKKYNWIFLSMRIINECWGMCKVNGYFFFIFGVWGLIFLVGKLKEKCV